MTIFLVLLAFVAWFMFGLIVGLRAERRRWSKLIDSGELPSPEALRDIPFEERRRWYLIAHNARASGRKAL